MLSWMIALASMLALPMLFRWRGRFVYAVSLVAVVVGVFGLALVDMPRPDHHGSPGDALGLAIVMWFVVMLVAVLLLASLTGLMVRAVYRHSHRRPPPAVPDC